MAQQALVVGVQRSPAARLLPGVASPPTAFPFLNGSLSTQGQPDGERRVWGRWSGEQRWASAWDANSRVETLWGGLDAPCCAPGSGCPIRRLTGSFACLLLLGQSAGVWGLLAGGGGRAPHGMTTAPKARRREGTTGLCTLPGSLSFLIQKIGIWLLRGRITPGAWPAEITGVSLQASQRCISGVQGPEPGVPVRPPCVLPKFQEELLRPDSLSKPSHAI